MRAQWILTKDNMSDIFTKNVDKATFEKHVKTICDE